MTALLRGQRFRNEGVSAAAELCQSPVQPCTRKAGGDPKPSEDPVCSGSVVSWHPTC